MFPVASIIVTCKGRLHHLRQTLPTIVAQVCPFEFEVIVVDYGCPQGAFEWCRELNAASLLAVRVLDGITPFNLSRARNIGAAHSAAGVLAFVDADMRLAPTWLAAACRSILAGRAGLCRPANLRAGPDRAGTCAVRAALFHQVRGYDEQCQGWGFDDDDFYRRVTRLARCAWYAPGLIWPIRHDDQARTAHYDELSILASAERNREYLARRQNLVNADGYGRGQFETFRGTGSIDPVGTWWRPQRHYARVRSPVP